MICSEAREEMLVADLTDIRGAGALGAHLESCASCRRLADLILEDSRRLADVVASRRPRVSRARIAIAAALPIAAALVVAVVMNAKRSNVAPTASAARLPIATHVSLTVAPGQTAAVLKTADPTVTVIWLSPGGGQ